MIQGNLEHPAIVSGWEMTRRDGRVCVCVERERERERERD
jgi:hypothetical protein